MDKIAYVNRVRSKVSTLLRAIEEVQGDAAAVVQGWNKRGGAAFLAGMTQDDWDGLGLTEAQVTAAVGSLGSLFPDLMGNDGTNLYAVE